MRKKATGYRENPPVLPLLQRGKEGDLINQMKPEKRKVKQ
jgi:hypothetical protein